MVGKGIETKSSRIFHQCYVKCCKLQNLTPLSNVLPTANGKVLDFCVDRIKYEDWPPILNALSCDLSLHSVTIKCRQPVKTVLEHVDCERLARTVKARCVALTRFVLSNLVAALAQLVADSELLAALTLDGLPLRPPYLDPLAEALSRSNLRSLSLVRCGIGDAGCAVVCGAVRGLPALSTLELGGCALGAEAGRSLGALLSHQKLARYSDNWAQTLRYRAPRLDDMAGLRRLVLHHNPLGDDGLAPILHALADDLWIKALDVQECALSEESGAAALRTLRSNTTLVDLELRHNPALGADTLAAVRAQLHHNQRRKDDQFPWLTNIRSDSSERLVKPLANKNGVSRDRNFSNVRNLTTRNNKANYVKKEKEYTEELEEQLQEEMTHRQQLEELNEQLVQQLRELRQQQCHLWASAASSGSTHSLEWGAASSSSGSSGSVPVEPGTLAYIQRAFRDIYCFIKDNQCRGQCVPEAVTSETARARASAASPESPRAESADRGDPEDRADRADPAAKRAVSSHRRVASVNNVNKASKSAHLLGDARGDRVHTKPEMFEKQMGDTRTAHNEDLSALHDMIAAQLNNKKGGSSDGGSAGSSSGSAGGSSVSSATLVMARVDPLTALDSSDSSDEDDAL